MSVIEKLQNAKDRKELSLLLGYKPHSLTYIIYKLPDDEKYKSFSIPKKSGKGARLIKAPHSKLKILQSHLANYLYQCLEEIKRGENFPQISYGFQKKLSIKDNASRHKSQRWVLNLDLSDFFPSINFGRVRGFFIKNKFFQLSPEVATTIAQIACDENALPQGSPCSPIISEFVAQILDVRLLKFAKKHRLTYSRYADDITFSTNEKQFPPEVAYPVPSHVNLWKLSDKSIDIVERSGFKINNEKTRVQHRYIRQMATGLVVNKKVNVVDSYYRNTRSMCQSVFKSGEYYIDPIEKKTTSNLSPLSGRLSFIYYIKQQVPPKTPQPINSKGDITSFEKLYIKFLFFKLFLNLDKPLIVTEGKTDPIYLRNAIKYNSTKHPALGITTPDKFEHKLSYFSHSKSYSHIFGLSNGGSNIFLDIMLYYQKYLHGDKKQLIINKPCKFPVILFLDNDDGLKVPASFAKKNFKVNVNTKTTSDFYFLCDNLYIVKTPESLPMGKICINNQTCIEDFFPDKILNTLLNGKTFNKANKIDPKTEYGKAVFATKVVVPIASSIDYSGFEQIFNRIESVIKDYKSRSI